MRRVLAVFFPSWSVDFARRRSGAGADEAVLVVVESAGRVLVEALSDDARARGVREGLTLAEARALLAPLVPRVTRASPAAELAALRSLGRWAMRFSPLVAVDPPDGLLLDVAGNERLFGSEAELMRAVERGLAEQGFSARIATADTVGAAWAAARCGPRPACSIAPGEEEAVLAPLSVAGLRIEDETVRALEKLGVVTIGELLALPRKKLLARFGGDLALRVDQALGCVFEPVECLEWEAPPEVERAFLGPVSDSGVVTLTVQELVPELCEELRKGALGASEVRVRVFPSDLPPWETDVALSRPTTDARLLLALILPKLESRTFGFGVERVVVCATATHPVEEKQLARFGGVGEKRVGKELGELLDVLAGRLGRERVRELSARESHVPERAFARVPLGDGAGAGSTTRWSRPSALLARPERLETEMTGRFPRTFSLRGATLRVVKAQGPERIEEPWWEPRPGRTRDYYRIETDEPRSLWIFRELDTDAWYLHGEWV